MEYFWLKKHLDQWRSAIENNHKPQAVIISGAVGLGKRALLQQILAELLCRQSDTFCGQCQNCLLFNQGHHPDVSHIEPENNLIKVKVIRELTQFFTSTPHCSDHKIAVINQADNMNTAAANSLLKVLEEPPSRGILFLLTDVKHQLMPTIRSRCINMDVRLSQNEKKQLANWLIEAHGNSAENAEKALLFNDFQPLLAMKMLQENQLTSFDEMLDCLYQAANGGISVTSSAKKLTEFEESSWELLQRYFMLVGKARMQQESTINTLTHPLNQIIKKSPKVFHIIIKITELVQGVMLNLNTQVKSQLLIESMLVEIKNELNLRR